MDREGFQRTLARHGNRAYSYAVWLVGDPDEAQDVVQEGLMRLWTHRSGVADQAGRSWLLRTIHRLCVDRHRRSTTRRETVLGAALNEPALALPAEGLAEMSELQSAIARAMAQVPPRDRALIVMREMQGMKYQEMAEVLEMPVNTLKPALHRARARLRQELVNAGVQS
jgi:RNA polymerase sigma-70 factor (ECF subfamily)